MFKSVLISVLSESYSDAHKIAQQNAALPIEKGGLGLHANNTAMERAVAMGYTTHAYHGTGTDISAFSIKKAHDKEGMRLGLGLGHKKIYFSTSATVASNWAGNSLKRKENYGSGKSPQIIPVLLKIKKPFSENEYLNHLYDNEDRERKNVINDLDKTLKNNGHDAIVGEHQIAVYHPNHIRSIHAAFDPMKKDSENILD